MDLNNQTFVRNFLNFGNFTLFNLQLSPKKRSLLNCLIKLILFINAAKTIAICLGSWLARSSVLRMYLIDALLFEANYQRLFDVGFSLVNVGLFVSFRYWSNLNAKINSLESFNFLFISKDLYRYYRQRYRLDKELSDKFLATYRLFSFLYSPIITAYDIFVFTVVARCFYNSFYTVSLAYFLSVGLFFFVLTVTAYLLLNVFVVSRFFLVLLSTEFLILRAKAIDRLLFNKILKTKLSSNRPLIKSRKRQKSLLGALRLIDDFFRQFRQINSVLDSLFSKILLGAYLILFGIPYFLIFAQNQLEMKLLLSAISVTVFSLCFSISVYNDRLRKQASYLTFEII